MSTLFEDKEDSTFEYWAKFLSGAFLFWLVGVVILFQKNKENKLRIIHEDQNKLYVQYIEKNSKNMKKGKRKVIIIKMNYNNFKIAIEIKLLIYYLHGYSLIGH